MGDSAKYLPVGGGGTLVSDLKTLSTPFFRARRSIAFVYGFMFAFVAFTIFLVLTPSSNSDSPLFTNIFTSSSSSADAAGSHFHPLLSFFFPNSPAPSNPLPPFSSRRVPVSTPTAQLPTPNNPRSGVDPPLRVSTPENEVQKVTQTETGLPLKSSVTNSSSTESIKSKKSKPPSSSVTNATGNSTAPENSTSPVSKDSVKEQKRVDEKGTEKGKVQISNQTSVSEAPSSNSNLKLSSNSTSATSNSTNSSSNSNLAASNSNSPPAKSKSRTKDKGQVSNLTASLKGQGNVEEKLLESMMKCDLFDGQWVMDDSYPLYKPGSCSLIDEQFNCYLNGRPDQDFQKLKWKPKGCTLPRLDGSRMLELLRGKRLVFVGDSLNRNMWESLVCILKNSVKDQSKVFESAGRQYFRNDASYSFIFQDYNFTVELFVTPFLVQEWEVSDKNGTKKETLRLDMVEKSCDAYKDADILIFNTGHWWTHEKTSLGKDYYQEGSHVYSNLNVDEAFRKAVTTWGRWVDANIDSAKTLVLFRGYSASHFSGGQWNSGGACDSETEPIRNETYLTEYPTKMALLERVIRGMKTHVKYMNITKLTDYRKDGHPSIYRKQNLSEEERKSPLRYQDCSHWCLPGVPDSWNELLYAEILIRQHEKQKQPQTIGT